MLKTLYILLAIAPLTLMCGEKKQENTENQTGQDATVNQIPFPHPENFAEISQHGFLALSPDNKAKCSGCHTFNKVESSQAINKNRTASTCTSCHSSYPHNWKDEKEHGKAASADQSACISCHENTRNLAAGLNLAEQLPPSCSSCHSSFPHPREWLAPSSREFHGKVAVRDGSKSCQQCHGADLRGGKDNNAASCFTCHPSYPHMGKMEEKHHQPEFNLNLYSAADRCGSCHLLSTVKNESEVYLEKFKNQSCNSCHQSYPHLDPKWMEKTSNNFHGKVGKAEEFKSCKNCHGEDLKGKGNNNKSCYSCHASYPHTEEWKSTSIHGENYVVEKSLQKISCTNCHGENLKGNSYIKDCNSCHKAYPNVHETVQFGGSLWNHKQYVENHVGANENTCVRCHKNEGLKTWDKPNTCRNCHPNGFSLKIVE